MNQGFWEKIMAQVRRWSHQVMGIWLDRKHFLSDQLFAKSQLSIMPKIFEGNYLPDAILLQINHSLIWQTLSAHTKKTVQIPANRREVPLDSGLCCRGYGYLQILLTIPVWKGVLA